jgi:hypothetical protein
MRRKRLQRRKSSVGGWDDETIQQKEEMGDAVTDYVTDKLARIRTSDSANFDEMTNELEVETALDEGGPDGYFAKKRNGNHQRRNGHS